MAKGLSKPFSCFSAGGERLLRCPPFLRSTAANADGRGRAGAADCLRKYRQSDAGARRNSPKRNLHSTGDWRVAFAIDSATAYGVRPTFIRRRSAGSPLRALGLRRFWCGLFPRREVPVFLQFSVDGRILEFTAGIAILTGILFGLLPAFRSTHVSLSAAMKGGAAR